MPIADLQDVVTKLEAGARLDAADLQALISSTDLVALGAIADDIRAKRVGADVTYVRVLELDAAAADRDWPTEVAGAGELRLQDRAGEAAVLTALERAAVRWPDLARTSATLNALAQVGVRTGRSPEAVLRRLKAAGLDAVCDVVVDTIPDLPEALDAARRAGVPVNAAGFAVAPASLEEWARHLIRLRPFLDEESVRAVRPLGNETSASLTGYDAVKRVALARVLLPDARLQIDWRRDGPKLAQVALSFGATDLDRVSTETASGRRAPLEEVLRNIRVAGRRPVERDGRFAVRQVFEG